MSASKLDAVYRSLIITKFFTKGWGKPENLRRLFKFRKIISNRDRCFSLISRNYPVTITKEESWSDCHVLEGHFVSPLDTYLPGIVPECAKKAHFQVILPLKWKSEKYKPMCLHLAGTGDHFFWRRRNLLAKPLLKESGIGAIILENPFYGSRKPQDQVRSCLHNVSDIFVMGGCLILESLVLFHWCERNGLGPLGVTGLSMGGHMASLAATNWPKPLVLVPCLSWSTASPVFTQGVMSHSINWELLRTQYFSDGEYSEKLSKMVTVVDEAFLAGKSFAKTITGTAQKQTDKTEQENQNPKPADPNNTSLSKMKNLTEKVMDYEKIKELLKKNDNGIEVILGRTALFEQLKINNRISDSLYKKVTAGEKFDLNEDEIKELNELNIKDIKTIQSTEKLSTTGNVLKDKTSANASNRVRKIIDVDEIFRAKVLEEVQLIKKEKLINDKNVKIIAKELVKASENRVMKVGSPRSITEITMDILSSIPLLLTKDKHLSEKTSALHRKDREALQFMRGVMDECTHLSNFTVPFDTSLIIAVCAKNDAYVPQAGSRSLEDVWPGAQVKYIDAGHVSAYVLHQKLFRSSITEAFERSKKKWLLEKEIEN